jgi:L-rhamnose mutarotase
MIRRAFTLRLKPGALAEYKERHDKIWPELVAEIERSGIARMTAFEADPLIFYFSEIVDEGAWDRLWSTDIHDRWAEHFKPLIDFTDDGAVAAGDLREIFHLETNAR